MSNEPNARQAADTVGELWQRRLAVLRSSLEVAPSHPFAWLYQIRIRILVFLLARYGTQLSAMPQGSRLRDSTITRRRLPAVGGGRPPRAGPMMRPMLFEIAELNSHLAEACGQ